MGKDWEEPIDKGPKVDFQSEQMCEPWKPGKKSKKPFVIERRYIGPPRIFLTSLYENEKEWHVYRRYAKASAMHEAYTSLTRKQGSSYTYYDRWEYRTQETE